MQFPFSKSCLLGLGLISGVTCDRDGSVLLKNSTGSLFDFKYATRLSRLTGKTSICKDYGESSVKSQLDFYASNYVDAIVPRYLSTAMITEQLNIKSQSLVNDPFMGNRLSKFNKLLAGVGGETMSAVSFYEFDDSLQQIRTLSAPIITFEFNTPVSQIIECKSRPDLPDVCIVKSMQAVHFIKSHTDEIMNVFQQFQFGSEPLHCCSNPSIPYQSATLLENGEILIWDLKVDGVTSWGNSTGSDNEQFKSCEFGSHPRTLHLGSRKSIQNADLRMDSSSKRAVIFTSDMLLCFKRSPQNPFHIAAATSAKTILLDVRYDKLPLLEWESNFNNEQVSLEFPIIKEADWNSGAGFFYTWGTRSSEIIGYSYTQSNSLPCQSFRPQLFAPFHQHESFQSIKASDNPYFSLESTPDSENLQGKSSLAGTQIITTKSGLTLFQLAEDGSIYAQGFTMEGANETTEIFIDSSLKAKESDIQNMIEKTDHLAIKSHRKIDIGSKLQCMLSLKSVFDPAVDSATKLTDETEFVDGQIIRNDGRYRLQTSMSRNPIDLDEFSHDLFSKWGETKVYLTNIETLPLEPQLVIRQMPPNLVQPVVLLPKEIVGFKRSSRQGARTPTKQKVSVEVKKRKGF